MLFPIKHENMKARRWPLVTIGLILVNTVVFLCAHQAMEDQEDPFLSVKAHVLVLAAKHPELAVPPEVQQLVTDFQRYYPADWAELQNPNNEANASASPPSPGGNLPCGARCLRLTSCHTQSPWMIDDRGKNS